MASPPAPKVHYLNGRELALRIKSTSQEKKENPELDPSAQQNTNFYLKPSAAVEI